MTVRYPPLPALAPLVILLALAGCGGNRASREPAADAPTAPAAKSGTSQILITVESFAGRRVAPFGGLIAMPRLSELVASGTTYDDAVATTTLARPSLVSILTGVSPDRSGVRDNIHDALPAGLTTLGEAARSAGFETAAFVSSPFASYSSGLQRGFGLFDGPEAIVVGPAQHAPPVVKATMVAAHFKEWLTSRTSDAPYFAWIHFADLNSLSVPLPRGSVDLGEQGPNQFKAYDDALVSIDAAIGAIVDAVRTDPRSLKVQLTVVGTHGTHLGEGGRFGDAFWLSDESLRVPLVRVKDLGAREGAGRHDARPTWLPDVTASLASAMSVSLNANADGIPLESQPPPNRARLAWGYALDDQLGWPPQTAVRDGAGFAVFSIAPGGTLTPASASSTPLSAVATARPAMPRSRVLSAEARASVLHAGIKLGSADSQTLPKKPDAWLNELQVVRRLLGGEHPKIAARRSKMMIDAEPHALASLVTRVFFFTSEPSTQGSALKAELLSRYPARSDALHWAAHVSLVGHKYDEAVALLDAAMAVGPVEPEMHYDLACARALRGDTKGALAELDRALSTGYRNWDWIDKDPDLSNVRADPGFPALLRTHGR
jgi:arylsulfatase A-like enzyme